MAQRSKQKKAAKAGWETWAKSDWFWGFALFLLVVLTYVPVWSAGYIWDDDLVLTANPVIIGPLGLKEIWTTAAADICPLTITTFWMEHALWGLSPMPYHVVTVAFHGAAALMLWQVLRVLRVPGGWLGAALWALHPVLVESVAWITEMKNTESGLFYLLAIFFFVRHLQAGEGAASRDSNWNYRLTLLFSAMAMASKSATVILPVVLCLCAWWMEGRWQWRSLMKTAPIFLMSVAAGLLSIWKQKLEGAYDASLATSGLERLATVGDDVWFYLGKLAWPHPLMMVYPHWQIDKSNVVSYGPSLGVAVVLFIFWWKRKSWGRPWFFAFAYFLVALIPVVGLVNMKYFIYSQVANHFQYLAAMGPLALVGAGVFQIGERAEAQKSWLPATLGAALVLVLGIVSWQEAWIYRDETTLWNDTLAQNPNCFVGYNNLGMVAVHDGKFADAMPLFQKAVEINPRYEIAQNNLGNSYLQKGDADEAIVHYEAALKLDPNLGNVQGNLGIALVQKRRVDEAIPHFQRALELDPTDAEAGTSLGLAYVQKGRLEEALTQFKKTSEQHPEDARAHLNYGSALFHTNRIEDAIVQFEEALRLKPDDRDANNNLAAARATLQKAAPGGTH